MSSDSSNAKVLNDADFQKILETKGLAIIDFWAPWCGPCKIMSPVFEQMSEDSELSSKAEFYQVNVDDNPDISTKFGITSIPTFYMIKKSGDGTFDLNRDKVGVIIGAQNPFDFKMNLTKMIESAG